MKQLTLFISNKNMGFYKEPYCLEKLANMTYYVHLNNIFPYENIFKEIKKICITKIQINIILVIENYPGANEEILECLMSNLLFLNERAIFKFLIGSCFGLNMYQYLFKFPEDSSMIILSDFTVTTYYSTLYTFTIKYFTIELILQQYILLFIDKLITPLIYIGNRRQIKSIFSMTKCLYYRDLIPILKEPSIEEISEIFLTDGLAPFEIEQQIIVWNDFYKSFTAPSDLLTPAQYRLKQLKRLENSNRNHPVQIIDDINIILQKNTNNILYTIKDYFRKLYNNDDLYFKKIRLQIDKFHLRLRINHELSRISISQFINLSIRKKGHIKYFTINEIEKLVNNQDSGKINRLSINTYKEIVEALWKVVNECFNKINQGLNTIQISIDREMYKPINRKMSKKSYKKLIKLLLEMIRQLKN